MPGHMGRAHALLSASSAARWLKCPPSAALAENYPNADTIFTREGTAAHEICEAIAGDLGTADDLARKAAETFGDDSASDMVRHAINYAEFITEHETSQESLRLLERRVDFSDWVPGGFGTCDCIIIQGDQMIVIDYKYGRGVAVSAVDNPQMRLYALGALSEYGFIYGIEKIKTIIYQPRLDSVSAEEITADELLAWGKKIKPIARLAALGKGEFSAGDHCRFCPHAAACEKLKGAVTEAVSAQPVNPAALSDSLKMKPLVEAWLRAVESKSLEFLSAGVAIPGFKLVAGRGSRSWSNEADVVAALQAGGFTEEDYIKKELLSPAQIEKALGKKNAAELVGALVVSKEGAPAVVPESDKRPPLDLVSVAQNDFKN